MRIFSDIDFDVVIKYFVTNVSFSYSVVTNLRADAQIFLVILFMQDFILGFAAYYQIKGKIFSTKIQNLKQDDFGINK